MITELYITGTPGLTYITNAELAFVTILTVVRQGHIYTEVAGVPSGREFKYDSSGRIDFDSSMPIEVYEVATSSAETLEVEKVYIKYKI